MNLNQIIKEINCNVITGEIQNINNFTRACSSDLMSDVLAFIKDDHTLLITGLCNQQVIRTAEMIDLKLIIFVRGKKPTEDIIELADENDIVLLSTNISMFDATGILYQKGMRGIRV
jgi:predicted transcriptional regulator